MGYGGPYGSLSSGPSTPASEHVSLAGINTWTAYDNVVAFTFPGSRVIPGAKLLMFLAVDTTVTITAVPAGWTLIDSRVHDVTKFLVYSADVTESSTLDDEYLWSLNTLANTGAFCIQVPGCGDLSGTQGSNATNTLSVTTSFSGHEDGSLYVAMTRKADGSVNETTWSLGQTMVFVSNENNILYVLQASVIPSGATELTSFQSNTSSLWNRMAYTFNPAGA